MSSQLSGFDLYRGLYGEKRQNNINLIFSSFRQITNVCQSAVWSDQAVLAWLALACRIAIVTVCFVGNISVHNIINNKGQLVRERDLILSRQ